METRIPASDPPLGWNAMITPTIASTTNSTVDAIPVASTARVMT